MSVTLPRVSIGLPVYNGEEFISNAIDALLGQTFKDFELIISDNGSTDRTEEICRAYAARDQRITYHRYEQNRGGAWNFNHVFSLARAEYFMWHAADDCCAPDLIERCVEVLDRTPAVILCHANTTVIDENGRPLMNYVEGLDLRSDSPYQRYKRYHYHDRDCPLCSIYFGLVRRDVLGQTKLMGTYVNSESNLMSELALRGQFHELADHLFFRRDHDDISTRKYTTHAERIAWYDPAKAGKGGHPGFQQLFEQIRSVTRVPMSRSEKIRCYGFVARYFLWLVVGTLRNVIGVIRQRMGKGQESTGR